MIHDQNITERKPLTAGRYARITVQVYTDDTKTALDTTLADGFIEWHLAGGRGNVVSKTSDANGGLTVDDPTEGSITIELLDIDTLGLATGEYTHIADFTVSGHKRGLFDGTVCVKNN